MKKILASTALGILSCCSAFFAVLFPSMFVPFGLFSSVLFSFCVYWSLSSRASTVISLSAVAVTSVIFAFFTGNMINALIAFSVFVPVGYAVAVSYLKKKSLNAAGGYVLISGALVSVITYLFYAYNETYPTFSLETANANLSSAVLEILSPVTSVLSAVELPSEVIEFYLFSGIPSYIAIWFLFATVVSYYIFGLCFRSSETDMSFSTSFTDFHVSRVGVILCSVIVLCTSFTSSTVLFVVSMNFLIIEFVVLAYSGLSTACYFIDFFNIPKAIKIVFFIVLIVVSVCLSLVTVFFALVGLADTLFNFRNRLKNSAV